MTNSQSTAGSRKRIVYAALSLLVTVGILTFLFSRVSFQRVTDMVRNADLRGILMFLVLSLSMSVFRTWRYLLLLQVSGYHPRRVALFLVVLVRNFFSDLLPARVGTLVYVYIVTGRLGIPFGPAASSFALAFLFDMIALAPLIILAGLVAGAITAVSIPVLFSSGLMLVLVLTAILQALPSITHFCGERVGRLRWLGEERGPRWGEAMLDAEKELRRAREAGVYTRVLVLSLCVRITKYGALYVFLFALLVPLGYALADLSLPKVFIGLCTSELAASLPVSGFAGLGAYEGAWAVTFRLLGFPGEVADLTAVTHHLLTQVYGYSLGALALVWLLLPFFKRPSETKSKDGSRSRAAGFYGQLATMWFVIALLLSGLYYRVPVASP